MFAGDASLSLGSAQTEPRAASLGALAGSLGGGSAPSPPPALRLEVTADVDLTEDEFEPASWPPPPPLSFRAATLRSLFLYGSVLPPPAPDIDTAEAGEVVHQTPVPSADSASPELS